MNNSSNSSSSNHDNNNHDNTNNNNNNLKHNSSLSHTKPKQYQYPLRLIAKEGFTYVLLSLIVTLLALRLSNSWLLTMPFLLISVFVIQFFRDPRRSLPKECKKNDIVSPADGKVICVERTQDPYQNKPAIKISIFMNVFNVHANRSPANGEVIALNYIKGKFFNADFDKASIENERLAMILKLKHTKEGNNLQDTITVVQIAGLIARRILCYSKVHDNLVQGERYGFIRFGSRVDVYLPTYYKPLVSIGDKIKATSSLLAKS